MLHRVRELCAPGQITPVCGNGKSGAKGRIRGIRGIRRIRGVPITCQHGGLRERGHHVALMLNAVRQPRVVVITQDHNRFWWGAPNALEEITGNPS